MRAARRPLGGSCLPISRGRCSLKRCCLPISSARLASSRAREKAESVVFCGKTVSNDKRIDDEKLIRLAAALLAESLSEKQGRALAALDGKKGNLSRVAAALSAETGASEPVCRRLLQRLRDLGLARAGSARKAASKGRKFALNALGLAVIAEASSLLETAGKTEWRTKTASKAGEVSKA